MKVNYKYFVDELKKHKYIMLPIIMLIIVPILLMCVLGFEYSTFPIDNIPTIIVNHDTSDTIQTLENNIANNDTFKIVCRSQNDNDIKEYIDEG
ncbi:ABC transporter permease, partial [Clostridium butyricum]